MLLLNTFLHLPLFRSRAEPVELEVIFTSNHPYIPNDLDNIIKLVMDALQGAEIYDNDRQVMTIQA